MTKVVMDTSSLISLGFIGLLYKSIEIIEIIIPEVVKDEIKELSKYKDKEGTAAIKVLDMINNGKISVVSKIKNRKKAKELLSKNVDYGESECIICCSENNITTLIMDDINAAYGLEGFAISRNIKMKISIAVLVELHSNKMIDDKQLVGYVKELIKTREWEGGVLEILAKRYLENFK